MTDLGHHLTRLPRKSRNADDEVLAAEKATAKEQKWELKKIRRAKKSNNTRRRSRGRVLELTAGQTAHWENNVS